MRFYKTENPTYLWLIIALTYLKKYEEDINPKTWNKDIDYVNAKQKDLNGFLLYHIVYYTDSKYNNTML